MEVINAEAKPMLLDPTEREKGTAAMNKMANAQTIDTVSVDFVLGVLFHLDDDKEGAMFLNQFSFY